MPPYRTHARPCTLALTLAAAGVATTAGAQTPAPAPGASQTVIVTAQKRPQRLQDVPVAVTVVTGQDIENRGIASFAELLTQIPNTSIDQNTAAQPTITIRGITSSTNNLGIVRVGMGDLVGRIDPDLVLPERLLEAVVREQAAHEGLTQAEDQLDRLDGLDGAHDAQASCSAGPQRNAALVRTRAHRLPGD